MVETQNGEFLVKKTGISSALLLHAFVGKTNKTAVLSGFLQNRTRQGECGRNCCCCGYGVLAWLKFLVTPMLLKIPLIWYICQWLAECLTLYVFSLTDYTVY